MITLSTCVTVTLMSGAISLVEGWRPFTVRDVALLALAAAFLSGAYYFIISSMRVGEMSLIAPFRYTGLLFALVLGYLIWDEVPNALAWGGIALLIGSGLYLLMKDVRR